MQSPPRLVWSEALPTWITNGIANQPRGAGQYQGLLLYTLVDEYVDVGLMIKACDFNPTFIESIP
jgi:hypothetical protein